MFGGHYCDIYDPTVEASYINLINVDGQLCNLVILDTGGSKEYKGFRDQWIENSDAIILVYSVTENQSFHDTQEFYKQIQRTNAKIPVVLVGNKMDQLADRKVSRKEGIILAQGFGSPFVETSALTGQNIQEVFKHAVRLIRRRHQPEQVKAGVEPALVFKASNGRETWLSVFRHKLLSYSCLGHLLASD